MLGRRIHAYRARNKIVLVCAMMCGVLALACTANALAASSASPDATSTATPVPSATQIDAYLAAKKSPMTGQGAAFLASGGRWQIDPRLLVAIAGAESSFGAITCAPFNAWGWGCPNGPYRFESWADGIDAVAQGLRQNYLSEGRTTVALINLKYAPIGAANDPTGLNNHWTMNVSRFLIELGGDPNDVDLDGIAGSTLLGFSGTSLGDEYAFSDAPSDDEDTKGDQPERETVVRAGEPRPVRVRVSNTGVKPWTASTVRLRRVDIDHRIVGGELGALESDKPVEPGDDAVFTIDLASAGATSGDVETTWRLEGPNGAFGNEIIRSVVIEVGTFVAIEPLVDVRASVGGESIAIVKLRNGGTDTWIRDGEDGVLLGVCAGNGAPIAGSGWINERAASRLLERTVSPGEIGSFALKLRGDNGSLALRPFTSQGWATGESAIIMRGSAPVPVCDAG